MNQVTNENNVLEEKKIVSNRYEFVFLVDIKNGNPNGDINKDNQPRTDNDGYGLMTDVCLKRKSRDYVSITKSQEEKDVQGINILIDHHCILDEKYEEAKEGKKDDIENGKQNILKKYWDVRTFGMMMTSKKYNCGVVKGPVQIDYGYSIDPIDLNILPDTITRCCKSTKTTENNEDVDQTIENSEDVDETTENSKNGKNVNQAIGNKWRVEYGLYVFKGSVEPNLAKKSGFTEKDLELFWESLENMLYLDTSSNRRLNFRGLYIFKHENMFLSKDFVKIVKKENVIKPRKIEDYDITIDENKLYGQSEIIFIDENKDKKVFCKNCANV